MSRELSAFVPAGPHYSRAGCRSSPCLLPQRTRICTR